MKTSIVAALLAGLGAASALSCSSTDEPKAATAPDEQDGGSAVSIIQVPVKGMTFDVRVAGPASGPVVMLLHGFPETSYEWRNQFAALANAGYRVVAPDQRGYSPGARPSAVSDYNILLLAQDVVGIADALGVTKFHLVGHDWGGGVAWAVGKLFEGRLITLNVLSTPHPDALSHELADHASCQYQDSAYFDTFNRPDAADAFVANDDALLRATYAGFAQQDIDAYVAALGTKAAMGAALDWYQANITNRQFNVPTLGAIGVPTMLVWGDQDPYFCRATVDLSAQFVSAPYREEVLPGADHWVAEKSSNKLNALLLDQMARYAGD